MCRVKCLGGSGTAAFLHQFFETSVLNFIIVTGRIGETHCIIFQHSRLFGFKLTLSLLPGCHDTLEIESVWTVWNWMFSCKSVQLFSFLTPNKSTFNVTFASTTTKLCAVNFQTLSCSKLSTLGNAFSSLYKWIIKPHSLLLLATRQYFWFSEKVKFIALSKYAAAFQESGSKHGQKKCTKTPKTEWKSIRPCVGSRV